MVYSLTYILLIIGVVLLMATILYRSSNRPSVLVKFGVIAGIFVLMLIGFGVYKNTAAFSNLPEELKSYIVNLNATKKTDDTKIKIKKVFLDLKQIGVTYSIGGSEKLVAIELKRKPDDIEAISTINGLWEGGKIIPQHGMFSMSYDTKEFIDPVYVVFYLSNGESVSFKVSDEKNVKSRIKTVMVNKTIEYGDSHIEFTKIQKGLSYSTLLYESDFMPTDLDITILDGTKVSTGNPSWYGGGGKYSGGVSFDPIKSEMLTIRVKSKSSGKEEVFAIDVQQ